METQPPHCNTKPPHANFAHLESRFVFFSRHRWRWVTVQCRLFALATTGCFWNRSKHWLQLSRQGLCAYCKASPFVLRPWPFATKQCQLFTEWFIVTLSFVLALKTMNLGSHPGRMWTIWTINFSAARAPASGALETLPMGQQVEGRGAAGEFSGCSLQKSDSKSSQKSEWTISSFSGNFNLQPSQVSCRAQQVQSQFLELVQSRAKEPKLIPEIPSLRLAYVPLALSRRIGFIGCKPLGIHHWLQNDLAASCWAAKGLDWLSIEASFRNISDTSFLFPTPTVRWVLWSKPGNSVSIVSPNWSPHQSPIKIQPLTCAASISVTVNRCAWSIRSPKSGWGLHKL